MSVHVKRRTFPHWLSPGAAPETVEAASLHAISRHAFVNLAFPAACVGCHAQIADDEREAAETLVCADCLEQLELFTGPTCRRCGARAPASPAARDECGRCSGVKLWFDEAIALGEYTGAMRQWLLRMKHRQGDLLSLAAGRLIWQHHQDRLAAAKPDVIVPVPMHWRRRWSHGTNSAAVIAEVLADRLRAPQATKLLQPLPSYASPIQFAALRTQSKRAAARSRIRLGYHLRPGQRPARRRHPHYRQHL